MRRPAHSAETHKRILALDTLPPPWSLLAGASPAVPALTLVLCPAGGDQGRIRQHGRAAPAERCGRAEAAPPRGAARRGVRGRGIAGRRGTRGRHAGGAQCGGALRWPAAERGTAGCRAGAVGACVCGRRGAGWRAAGRRTAARQFWAVGARERRRCTASGAARPGIRRV